MMEKRIQRDQTNGVARAAEYIVVLLSSLHFSLPRLTKLPLSSEINKLAEWYPCQSYRSIARNGSR